MAFLQLTAKLSDNWTTGTLLKTAELTSQETVIYCNVAIKLKTICFLLLAAVVMLMFSKLLQDSVYMFIKLRNWHSKSWGVNRHTMRRISPISVVSQHKLLSG